MSIYARPGTTASIVTLQTRYENFIGGEWVKPVHGGYAEDLAPATGGPFAEYARSTTEDVDRAVAAAQAAFPGWAATSTVDRAGVLTAIADHLQAHLEQIAVLESWENGKPVRETLGADIPLAIDHFRRRAPTSPLAGTAPWDRAAPPCAVSAGYGALDGGRHQLSADSRGNRGRCRKSPALVAAGKCA
jgi:hypothetical protein